MSDFWIAGVPAVRTLPGAGRAVSTFRSAKHQLGSKNPRNHLKKSSSWSYVGDGVIASYFTTSVSQPGIRERNVDVDPMRA